MKQDVSRTKKWGLFLSYADDERQGEYIDEITRSEEGIMQAKSSLLTVSQDEINWATQNSIFIAREDQAAILYNAEQRGARQNAIANARNALNMGLSPEQVSQITELPLEQVLTLKNE